LIRTVGAVTAPTKAFGAPSPAAHFRPFDDWAESVTLALAAILGFDELCGTLGLFDAIQLIESHWRPIAIATRMIRRKLVARIVGPQKFPLRQFLFFRVKWAHFTLLFIVHGRYRRYNQTSCNMQARFRGGGPTAGIRNPERESRNRGEPQRQFVSAALPFFNNLPKLVYIETHLRSEALRRPDIAGFGPYLGCRCRLEGRSSLSP